MNSFSGKAAKQAKNYFSDMHLTVLESFQGVFADLSENLEQHIETFESEVDPHESAVIESHYLLEVKEDINDIYEGLIEEDEEIHDTIEDISDISSAKVPDFSDVSEWKKKSVKHLTELDGDLASFTSTGNETDVEEILSQIEAVIDSAQTSEGKARFSDFKGASEISELEKLVEYNEDKQEEEMENAKEVKENTIEELNEDSSIDVINKAYQEYKDGDISYDQYIAILDSVKNTSDDMNEKTIKENADEEFIQYLKDRGLLEDYLVEHKIVDEQEKIKKLGDGSKSFLDTLETGYKNGDLSKEDYEELRSIVIEEGSKESDVEKRQQDILKAIETVGEYSEIPTSSAAGLLMKDYGDLLEGKNNLNLGPKLMNRMKSLTGTLKSGGSILTLVGTTVGYYDDVNNDKTPGQAIAHNGASLLASGGAALGVVLAASGPAGWLAAGVSTGVGIAFKAAYDNNFLGLQTGLDWTGEKIDDGLDWAGEKISDGWQWYKGQVKENWKMQTEMAGEAVNWAGGRLDDAQEQLGNARDWAGDQLDNAVDGMRETGERVRDGVQNAADTAVDFANDVGDAVSGGLDAINPFS